MIATSPVPHLVWRAVQLGSWRVPAIAVCAASCALLTACAAGAPSSGSASSAPAQQASMTAAKAISLAAHVTSTVSSMSGVVEITGSAAVYGNFQLEHEPMAEVVTLTSVGSIVTTSDGLYEEMSSGLNAQIPGISSRNCCQPWVEIPFSELTGTLQPSLAALVQQVADSDPVSQAQILATSATNTHKAGTAVTYGVSTTKYAGSFSPSEALSKLPSSLSQQLAPALSQISGSVSWEIWLTSRHKLWQLVEHETVSGQPMTVTMKDLDFTQPVDVLIPPTAYVVPTSLLADSTG